MRLSANPEIPGAMEKAGLAGQALGAIPPVPVQGSPQYPARLSTTFFKGSPFFHRANCSRKKMAESFIQSFV